MRGAYEFQLYLVFPDYCTLTTGSFINIKMSSLALFFL